MLRLVVFLISAGIGLFARAAVALPQTGSTPAIRVESNLVLVSVSVYTKDRGDPVVNLAAPDFRLFEDGKEQTIQHLAVERVFVRDFRDNSGIKEREYGLTPGNIWSELGGLATTTETGDVYLLAYVPPFSARGSCHEVKIKVNSKKGVVTVWGDKYCNIPHSLSDPLLGTKWSSQMELAAASTGLGKIPLALQAGFFRKDTKTSRTHITVEFPSRSVRYRPDPDGLRYEVGVLAMAYRTDGTLAARSSDMAEDKSPMSDLEREIPEMDASIRADIPNHHETQMELPPGDYDIRVVVSDGSKFGRADVPITVDSYDDKRLGISSIILCKQFHEHSQTVPDPGHQSTLSDFVFLVSKGMEFTPAGDTHFATKDSLFVYYEIYEPSLAKTPGMDVQIRVRIVDTQTGELKSDTGSRSAADWIQPGNPVIAVSQQVAIKELAKGSYRIEVQASDAVGRNTVWRTASFAIQSALR